MAFASDAQRRWWFSEVGEFSGPRTDRAVAQHAVDREAAVRSHHEGMGFSAAAVDRAVERARDQGFGNLDAPETETRTLSYDDKNGWSASEWTAYSYGLGAAGKQEREEDNWSAKQWAAFTAGGQER